MLREPDESTFARFACREEAMTDWNPRWEISDDMLKDGGPLRGHGSEVKVTERGRVRAQVVIVR